MTENAVVRARIDERIKTEAAVVLAAMGLTVSDAFRLMMTRIAAEKALPFEPLVPNAETIKAVQVPAVTEKLRKAGVAPMPLTSDAFAAMIKREVVDNIAIAKAAGIKPN